MKRYPDHVASPDKVAQRGEQLRLIATLDPHLLDMLFKVSIELAQAAERAADGDYVVIESLGIALVPADAVAVLDRIEDTWLGSEARRVRAEDDGERIPLEQVKSELGL
jgi:hypothetical protein